jgi:hypothetical protein
MIKEGSLQDFSLPDLLQILVLGQATGTLTLRSEGRTGSLSFDGGRLVAASLSDRAGEDAAAALFLWTSGVFDFLESPPSGTASSPLALDAITQEGLRRLDRQKKVLETLPSFFSSRTWLHPVQMYQSELPALLQAIGSGKTFAELARASASGELDLLETVAELYQADQLGLSCAPEELLRQLFYAVATELFTQFASISGVKMVDSLEAKLNEEARTAALSLRWRGGKLQDNLPLNWNKDQLLQAYRQQYRSLTDFIVKVYGPAFVERVVQPLLDTATPPQLALWEELSAAPSSLQS